MASNEEERFKVPLFDGSNYHTWKFRMEILLDELDLLDFVKQPLVGLLEQETGVEAAATRSRNNEKKHNDKVCKRRIVSKVADTQIEYLQGKETAYDMWKSLQIAFERESLTTQFRLKKQLDGLKANSREPLSTHFLNLERLVREYKSAGGTLTEREIVLQLFQSLPQKEYQNVISSLETLSIADCTLVTMQVVKGRLLDEESKLVCSGTLKEREERQSSAAFMAQTRNQTKTNPYQSSADNIQTANNKSSFPFKCHFCHKTGHKKSECRKLARKNNQEKNATGTAHTAETCKNEVATFDYCFSAHMESYTPASSIRSVKWYLDSGASEHLVSSREYLSEVKPLPKPIRIKVAKSGSIVTAESYGCMIVKTHVGGKSYKIKINDVLFVPDLESNLLSVRKLEVCGFAIVFANGKAVIKHKSTEVAVAVRTEKLYELWCELVNETAVANLTQADAELWHRRLGHIGKTNLEKMEHLVDGMDCKKAAPGQNICETCIAGKQTKLPHDQERPRTRRPLELIHSDVMGPINIPSWNSKRYVLCFVDDYTHFTVVYCMAEKSETFRFFKAYEAMATAHFNLSISRFRCDRGTEYLSDEMKTFFESKGIQYECTIRDTPQQNGVSERMNRTIAEKARCMLLESGLNKYLWSEAVLAAAYVINRVPTSALENKVPAEVWYDTRQDVKKIRVFGCVAYLHPPKRLMEWKFGPRSVKCYMVGYCHNGYRLWCPEQRKVLEGRDVTFNEFKFAGDTETTDWDADAADNNRRTTSDENADQPAEEVTNEDTSENREATPVPRQSTRQRKPPSHLKDFHVGDDIVVFALSAETFVDDVPQVYEDIQVRDDGDFWNTAVVEELNALKENKTWTLCELPPGRKALGNRWVFKVKRDSGGAVQKYKARLVVKGCSQQKGFDYTETYAPVARLTTLRILLSLANAKKLKCEQLDVNNAFLNGDLQEEIFMKQPQGVDDGTSRVCKLNKSLYGLKQAPRAWNEKFDTWMKSQGFEQCKNDLCLYVKKDCDDILYVLLYVDDVILAGNNDQMMESVKSSLMSRFRCKDLGVLSYFVGIKVTHTDNGIFLSNEMYLKGVLKRFEMENCNPISTPLEVHPPRETEGPCIVGLKPYRELVGCLMYAMLTTRPDLCVAVNFYSRYQTNATQSQWVGLKRVLRYVKATLKYGLFLPKFSQTLLVGYADADWASEADRKSTSGYLFEVFGGVVSWSTRKQSVVALSSTEAEYIALSLAACELLWLKNLLNEMFVKTDSPILLYEDNMSCIHQLSKPESSRQKHVDVKYHFVKDLVAQNQIDVHHLKSDEQKADILTKGLPSVQFNKLRTGLGILPLD
jgi:transposase InsO family protein